MFYLLIKGEGEGCDYTIACNQKFIKLKATDLIEALKEARQICDGYDDLGIEKAIVLSVMSEHTILS